jgi:hypothetical protein
MSDLHERSATGLGRKARLILVLVAMSAVIALATSAGGLVGTGRKGTPAAGQLAIRVTLGALVAVGLGLAALSMLHGLAENQPGLHRLLYGTKERGAGAAVRRAIPLLLLLAGIGALVGASLTPLTAQTTLPKPKPSKSADQQTTQKVNGRYADVDRDGKPELEVDADGDGVYESRYVACPGSTLPSPDRPPPTVAGQPEGTVRIPVDDGCDGTIDRYLDVKLTDLGKIKTAPNVTVKPDGSVATTTPKSQSDRSPLPSMWGTILLVLLAIGIILAIVVGILKRKPKPVVDETKNTTDATDEAVVAIASSVAQSSDQLAVQSDPRHAILAAYRTLLDGLAAAGLPRRPEEAPEEYLHRCLSGIAVDHRPFHELTRLFTLARFSSHPITEAHRSQAAFALHQAGESMRSVPGQRAPA